METASTEFKNIMNNTVNPTYHMSVTLNTSTPLVYEDDDIFKFTETRFADLIAGELPTVSVSLQIDNTLGLFNPDSPNTVYNDILNGVKLTYNYGLELSDGTTEWIKGGEVYTNGSISYDNTSCTIDAVDALSLLNTEYNNDPTGSHSRYSIIHDALLLSSYPLDDDGIPKAIYSDKDDLSLTSAQSTDLTIKETIQSVAYASSQEMYIDRDGYLHIDTVPRETGTVDFHLTLDDIDEDPTYSKSTLASSISIAINTGDTDVIVPVTKELNGTGDICSISNVFIESSNQANLVMTTLEDYLKTRNSVEVTYRGNVLLDPLDIITFDTLLSTDLTGTITTTNLTYDGSLSGSLTIKYKTNDVDNDTLTITGTENFIYSDGNTVSPSTVTLKAVTSMIGVTYYWDYYNDNTSTWTAFGSTASSITIQPTSDYFVSTGYTIFRVKATDSSGASKITFTRIKRKFYSDSFDSNYIGMYEHLPTIYATGSYFLVSENFSSTATGETLYYLQGQMYQWNRTEWVEVTSSQYIVNALQDALTLDMPETNTTAINLYILGVKGNTGDEGEDAISVQIYSSNGNIFRDGTVNTTLTCYVFQGEENITDTLDASKFSWIRSSSGTALSDSTWNTSSKAIGKKTIVLTPDDVIKRTVFSCEVDI